MVRVAHIYKYLCVWSKPRKNHIELDYVCTFILDAKLQGINLGKKCILFVKYSLKIRVDGQYQLQAFKAMLIKLQMHLSQARTQF